jgi:Rieske 2Fe-2S family protein
MYTDPAHHELELKHIFANQWLYVGRSSAIAQPKDYLTVQIGAQSILLVRDQDLALHGFHNTCRHRGSQLCDKASGKLTGVGIRCPYHAWRYDLKGQLSQVPLTQGREQIDFGALSLHRVAVREWRGFVYIHLNPNDQSFDTHFSAHEKPFQNWPLERLVVGRTLTKTIRCNWKVFWENYNECLHCPAVHPALIDRVPIYKRGIMEPKDDAAWASHQHPSEPLYQGGLKLGTASWTLDGQSLGYEFPLTAAERALGYHYLTQLPAHYLVLHVDHVRSTRVLPLSVNETQLRIEWLFAPELLQDSTVNIHNAVDFSKTVMEEDATVCEAVQRGLQSQAFKQGLLMPEEYDVYRFQEWVRQQLPPR